jgi:hypothetical protein
MSLLTYVAIFVFIVLGVLWGISFHLVRTKKLEVNKWFLNSLGLPRGTVRAIIAIAFITTLICSSLEGAKILDLPDWAVGITGSIIGFYFGAATNRRDTPEDKTPSTGTQQTP